MSLASDATAATLVVPVSVTVLCVSVNGSSMLHEHTFDNLLISALFNPISPPRQLYSSTVNISDLLQAVLTAVSLQESRTLCSELHALLTTPSSICVSTTTVFALKSHKIQLPQNGYRILGRLHELLNVLSSPRILSIDQYSQMPDMVSWMVELGTQGVFFGSHFILILAADAPVVPGMYQEPGNSLPGVSLPQIPQTYYPYHNEAANYYQGMYPLLQPAQGFYRPPIQNYPLHQTPTVPDSLQSRQWFSMSPLHSELIPASWATTADSIASASPTSSSSSLPLSPLNIPLGLPINTGGLPFGMSDSVSAMLVPGMRIEDALIAAGVTAAQQTAVFDPKKGSLWELHRYHQRAADILHTMGFTGTGNGLRTYRGGLQLTAVAVLLHLRWSVRNFKNKCSAFKAAEILSCESWQDIIPKQDDPGYKEYCSWRGIVAMFSLDGFSRRDTAPCRRSSDFVEVCAANLSQNVLLHDISRIASYTRPATTG
ncbi:hypothetical protein B0H14DRAFT_2591673 [Mycena olivaceomarginata]|nr:hypothetical protein B0H14DRAFT_2591673 [Mycena olivaceomarginata]